jgi:translation initiation factor 2 gamma subunit (eIF-2gamma)
VVRLGAWLTGSILSQVEGEVASIHLDQGKGGHRGSRVALQRLAENEWITVKTYEEEGSGLKEVDVG